VDRLPLSLEPWILPIHDAIEVSIQNRREKARADAEYKAKHSR
jgi:hypothetical protein